MRNLIILFLIFSLLSCNSEDDSTPQENQVNQEYLDDLLGWYELKAIYTNHPIDLNGDGVENKDIYDEVVYCNMSTILDSYRCTVVDRGSYQRISFDAPTSNWSNIEQDYNHCLKSAYLFSDIIIDSINENVTLNTLDYESEFMLEDHRTTILDFRWEDRVVYLTLEQKLMTPSDVWKTVIMNLEYEWVHSET